MRLQIPAFICMSILSLHCTKTEKCDLSATDSSLPKGFRLQQVDSPILGNKILRTSPKNLTKEETAKIVKIDEEIYLLLKEKKRLEKELEK